MYSLLLLYPVRPLQHLHVPQTAVGTELYIAFSTLTTPQAGLGAERMMNRHRVSCLCVSPSCCSRVHTLQHHRQARKFENKKWRKASCSLLLKASL